MDENDVKNKTKLLANFITDCLGLGIHHQMSIVTVTKEIAENLQKNEDVEDIKNNTHGRN